MSNTVMIVDDSVIILARMKEGLTSKGYTAITVNDPTLALQTALDNDPDFIIIDIMMPGMSGFEVCKALKSDPLVKHIPVMFCSGTEDSDEIIASFHYGSVDFIKKPVVIEELIDVIFRHDAIKKLTAAWEPTKRELERVIDKYKD